LTAPLSFFCPGKECLSAGILDRIIKQGGLPMKKLFSVSLVLMVLLGALGSGALAESGEVAGVWYLNEVVHDGVSVSAASFGLEMIITLNADGSALAVMTDEESETGSWSREGDQLVVTIEGDDQVFALVGEALVAEEGDSQMIFGREPAAVESYQPAAMVPNPLLEDFDGAWAAALVDAEGVQLPVKDMGVEMTLRIGEGLITMNSSGGWPEVQMRAVLQDGVLQGLPMEGEEVVALSLTLHEDGVLSTDMGDERIMYFERQPEE